MAPPDNNILLYRVERIEAELAKAEREIDALRAESDARDRGYWRAGVIFLGGVVMTLIGVIWANLGTIFTGK